MFERTFVVTCQELWCSTWCCTQCAPRCTTVHWPVPKFVPGVSGAKKASILVVHQLAHHAAKWLPTECTNLYLCRKPLTPLKGNNLRSVSKSAKAQQFEAQPSANVSQKLCNQRVRWAPDPYCRREQAVTII